MSRHPNSLANLQPNRDGSKPIYGTRKKKRGLSLTDEAWDNLKVIAKEKGTRSASELVEQIARGKFELAKTDL